MIIVNGRINTLVIFGDVSQQDFQMFMVRMAHAINEHQQTKGEEPA